jgi:hypothetical protein
VSAPGHPRRVHAVIRQKPGPLRGTILAELAVCHRCGDALDIRGMTVPQCRARWGPPRQTVSIKAPAAAPQRPLVIGRPVQL